MSAADPNRGGKTSNGTNRAKARWSILRNALLQTTRKEHMDGHKNDTLANEGSIHRFPGYRLLSSLHSSNDNTNDVFLKDQIQSPPWDKPPFQQMPLGVLCSAVAAIFPSGQCIEVPKNHDNVEERSSWIDSIQEFCAPTVDVCVLDDKKSQVVTLWVQEASSNAATKHKVCQYRLDDNCSLWTREPRQTRLSLQDLVSHRTKGVDNTGNVCVWDSEQSLAYLLYHYWQDFLFSGNVDATVTVDNDNVPVFSSSPSENYNILELGTGMAGLAAVSLGLRLAQLFPPSGGSINVTLTDGHPDGVLNNQVNQCITSLALLSSNSDVHPYHLLNIQSQLLLWTTEFQQTQNTEQQYDIVLASDCVHFQNFHAALAITTLRSLRVGGMAIFCQPTRGNSLGNFYDLLTSTTTTTSHPSSININPLLETRWWTHSVLDEQDKLAREKYSSSDNDTYDVNLHCPKILLVRKSRELTEHDCQWLVQFHQQQHKQ